MEIPFFIFEFEDGSVYEIITDQYEMGFDDNYAINKIEIYAEDLDLSKLKIGKKFKLLSYTFGVWESYITIIENFDYDLVERFDMKAPLYLINIDLRSDMFSGDDYLNYKKLYDRKRKINKIIKDDTV